MNSKRISLNSTGVFVIRLGAMVMLMGCLARAAGFSGQTKDGFAIPQPGRHFVFPRDHGSHPDFAIEWWYITGHLCASNERQFGFQATFFRLALAPPGTAGGSSSAATSSAAFGSRQIYMAHMALVDKNSGRFIYQERLNRDGWDAYSSTNTLDVRNGNWSLRLLSGKTNVSANDSEKMELQASIGADASFDLDLTPQKPLVVFGVDGVSRKASDPAAASHYLTYPLLAVKGGLNPGETNMAVAGRAWMDHEFSSSQLGAGQVGWDWLSLQLEDGRELMAYRMRRNDGSTDPFSTVAWIDQSGKVLQEGPRDFKWTILDHWHSTHTQADYPSLVKLEALNPFTARVETFVIQPFVADQELVDRTGRESYWEGASRVLDANKKQIGLAYMELTGYAKSLNGRL